VNRQIKNRKATVVSYFTVTELDNIMLLLGSYPLTLVLRFF